MNRREFMEMLIAAAAVVGMGSLEHLRINVSTVRDAEPLNKKERKVLEKHMS